MNRCEEARGAYLEALRLDPDLAHSHLQIGMTLRVDGQLAEAEPWFKQAVDLDPENAWFWEQLARPPDGTPGARRGDPVLGASHRAVREGAGRPAHQPGLVASGRQDGSPRQWNNTELPCELQPEAVMAQINLGGIHEELGEMAAAEAAYRTAARIQPNFGLAYARLGTLLRGTLARSPTSPRIEERLADPETNPSARARLLFALCLVLDARGEYARAAECSRQANALNMELARGPRGYTPDLHVQYVESVMRGFTDGAL